MKLEPSDLDRHLGAFSRAHSKRAPPVPDERVFVALQTRVVQDLSVERGPRPAAWLQGSRAQRVWLSAGVVLLVLLLSTRSALSPQMNTLGATLALGLTTAVSLWWGGIAGPGRMSPGQRRLLIAFVPILALFFLGISAQHFLAAREFLVMPVAAQAASCLVHSWFSGGLTALALFAIWRNTDPFAPRESGAFLGMLAGIVGCLSVELTCTSHEGLHLTLSHGLVALLLSALGWRLGRGWLNP